MTHKHHKKSHKGHRKDDSAADPQWLYDEIMRQIEPDLCSHQLPHLEEKYKDETPKEKIFRMRAYEMAFALFDSCMQDIKDTVAIDVAAYKKQARKKATKEEQSEHNKEIETIESLLKDSQAA